MFCPSCGKGIPDESKFCLYCGESIATPHAELPKPEKVANSKVSSKVIPSDKPAMYIKGATLKFSDIKDERDRRGFTLWFEVADEDGKVTRTDGELELRVLSGGFFLTKVTKKIMLKKEDFKYDINDPKWLGYIFPHPQPILVRPMSAHDSYTAFIKLVTAEGRKIECSTNSVNHFYS